MTERKGRSDVGAYRPNKPHQTIAPVDGEAVERIAEVAPLFHTYDQAKPEGAYFDHVAADHVVDWIENNVRHYKGEWAGKPFELEHWQKRLLSQAFGWKRENGSRVYTRCFVMTPRKAGKTTLAAAIAEYLFFADGENAAQIIFAAHTRDQAKICYDATMHGVEQNKPLWDLIKPYKQGPERMEMRADKGASYMRPIANEGQQAQGLEVHGLIFDELAQVKNDRRLWTALTKGSATRKQPFLLAITTADYERDSIAFEQYEKTRQIMEGTTTDPAFLGVVYGAPVEADWTSPDTWAKANPSYGSAVRPEAYQDMYDAVKASPGEQNEFRIFALSQWVGQSERYISMEAWTKCDAPLAPPNKRRAWGGLDLSATTDLSCFSLVAENPDGTLDLFTYPFIPGEDLGVKVKRDGANYDLWAEQGHIALSNGASIDQGQIRKTILEAAEQFDIQDISYDRHLADRLVQDLEGDGFSMVMVRQNKDGYTTPIQTLLELVVETKLHHGGHPVLRWSVDHFAVKKDVWGSMIPDKMKGTKRIDPVVSALMALDGWQRRGKAQRAASIYDFDVMQTPKADPDETDEAPEQSTNDLYSAV